MMPISILRRVEDVTGKIINRFRSLTGMKGIAADTFLYGSLKSLVRLVGVLSVPLYAYFLSQSQFGALDVVLSASAFFSLVIDWQFELGVARYFYAAEKDGKKQAFMSSCLWTRGLMTVACFLAFLLIASPLSGWLFPDVKQGTAQLTLAMASVVMGSINSLFWLYCRLLFTRRAFIVTSLMSAVITIGLEASFLLAGWGITGVLGAMLVANVVVLIVQIYQMRAYIRFVMDYSLIKPILAFTLPMVLSPLLGWSLTYLNRFIMVKTVSLEEIALFALASKVNIGLTLVASAFQTAWMPVSMKQIDKPDSGKFYGNSLRYSWLLVLGVTLVLSLAAGLIVFILAPKVYAESARYIPVLAVSSSVMMLANIVDIGNQISKRTWWSTIARVFGVISGVSIMLLGVGRFGLLAIVAGGLFASVVIWVTTFVTSQHNHHLPYKPSLLLWGWAGFGIILACTQLKRVFSWPWMDPVMAVLVLICLVLVIERSDRIRLVEAIRSVQIKLKNRWSNL